MIQHKLWAKGSVLWAPFNGHNPPEINHLHTTFSSEETGLEQFSFLCYETSVSFDVTSLKMISYAKMQHDITLQTQRASTRHRCALVAQEHLCLPFTRSSPYPRGPRILARSERDLRLEA